MTSWLHGARKNVSAQNNDVISDIRALIVPHAGYIYSGEIAACAYRLLLQKKGKYKRVLKWQ